MPKQTAGWMSQCPQAVALLQQEAWSVRSVPLNTLLGLDFINSPRTIVLCLKGYCDWSKIPITVIDGKAMQVSQRMVTHARVSKCHPKNRWRGEAGSSKDSKAIPCHLRWSSFHHLHLYGLTLSGGTWSLLPSRLVLPRWWSLLPACCLSLTVVSCLAFLRSHSETNFWNRNCACLSSVSRKLLGSS